MMNTQTVFPLINKKTTRVLYLFILAIILIIAGCSPAQEPLPMESRAEAVEVEKIAEQAAPVAYDMASGNVAQEDRLVIQNADLSLVVDDPEGARDEIGLLASSLGGYVVSARAYQEQLDNGRSVVRAAVTIRVPAEKLNEALQRIRSLSDQAPITENLNSQDVTQEYTDLQARLRNEEAAEAQLSMIMQDANRTEDVLNVYRELVQVRQRIEQIKGQIQYYEQSAALSAIAVELIPNEAVQPLEIGGWQPAGVAKNAVQALINSAKFIANALIWIGIYILPVLAILFVIIGLPIWLIVRGVRRRRARQSLNQEAPVQVEKSG
jgi:chemotaxis protein histidine kinase CheA